ncbi:hypothetical protein BJV78DRAFT_1127622 [Lactifluus subvellereus]|nr:hypothetical protein BJV78DRAFT_1127622 [Lactifluus subvellereus]
MSQSLRAIKRFRLRELVHPPKSTPSATAANPKLPPPVPDLSSSSQESSSGAPVTPLLNPFIPHKNLASGRWAPPRYSLRRQAELIKHARASNTLYLLPPGPKLSAAAAQREQEDAAWWRRTSVEWTGTVRERGLAGADIGARLYAGKKRMFKGHKWERMRKMRASITSSLVGGMKKRLQRFKRVRARLPPPSVFFFLCVLTFFFCSLVLFLSFSGLVPRQWQTFTAGKEIQRVEEDAEAAVLVPKVIMQFHHLDSLIALNTYAWA